MYGDLLNPDGFLWSVFLVDLDGLDGVQGSVCTFDHLYVCPDESDSLLCSTAERLVFQMRPTFPKTVFFPSR